MFKFFKKVESQQATINNLVDRLRALEEYHEVAFFNGPNNKPHYRKAREPKKRPYTKRKTEGADQLRNDLNEIARGNA